jgi:hypothetical protein
MIFLCACAKLSGKRWKKWCGRMPSSIHFFLYSLPKLSNMKYIAISICTAAILFACNSDDKKTADTKVAAMTADAKAKTDEWVAVDTATANKAMAAYMTPGASQAMLAKAAGEWVADITMWMEPGGQPMTAKGTATNKMILGGRYQQSTNKSEMMGMSFEGIGTTGYDNAKKVFVSSWVDNMGTGIMNMEGPLDEATKTITLKGKVICPANNKECDMRETIKLVDDNTQVMEMYGPDMKTGKEYKSMEIKFTRKK